MEKLGRYEIITELGRGNFATVYRALDTRLEREIALKVLNPLLSSQPDFKALFKREARTAARLRHAHIATIYDYDESQGHLYIAMEWIEGSDLRKLVRQQGPLPLPQVLTIIEHVADALACAHQQGLVHRDIKAANILLARDGRAVLTDFGLATAIAGSMYGQSMGGSMGITGTVEYLAEDDAHGLLIARNLVAKLDWNKGCPDPKLKKFAEPRYSADEIAGLVPPDYRKPYEVRELVARFVDDSDFEDFKPRYGVSTVCLQASIYGNACGIIGNNGPIDPAGATKGGQFFQLCDQANIPIIFLNNTTGYMVGKEYEQGGMVKHGSKMIQAVSNVRVPKITLYIGASFGAGNYGMGGHGYEPEFLFTWPNALTGVMGGEQAANTMDQVARVSAERRGQEVDEAALKAQKDRLIAHFDAQSDAFYTSGRLLDQGMIDPRDTRRVLGFALETCWEARNRDLHPNAFGVARL